MKRLATYKYQCDWLIKSEQIKIKLNHHQSNGNYVTIFFRLFFLSEQIFEKDLWTHITNELFLYLFEMTEKGANQYIYS